MHIAIAPLLMGSGERLFADGTIPMAFRVTESNVIPGSDIVENYERAGAITT